MKQFHFQNYYGVVHPGRFVVVHLYSSFSVDPQNFPLGANLYQNCHLFAILGAVSPHFKATTVKFGTRMQTWDSFSQAKFSKNRLRRYTPFGQIIPKRDRQTKKSHFFVYSRRATHDPHHTWLGDRGDPYHLCTP